MHVGVRGARAVPKRPWLDRIQLVSRGQRWVGSRSEVNTANGRQWFLRSLKNLSTLPTWIPASTRVRLRYRTAESECCRSYGAKSSCTLWAGEWGGHMSGRSIKCGTLIAFFSSFVCLSLPASAWAGDAWEPLASMNLARQETGAARIGGKVYVVGGLITGFVATPTVEAYDIALNQWSFVAPLPIGLDHMAVAAAGGKLFVMGGYAGNFQARTDVRVYDPATNSWSNGPALPSARGACWAVEHGGKIYLFGGRDAAGVTRRTTFILDPQANLWSTGADMPTAREHLTAASLGAYIYVVGGRNGPSTAVNERYDPAANQWQTMAPMPTARSATATASLFGRLHVAGGEIPMLFDVHEVYDPQDDSWSTAPSMSLPRHGVAAVALDDRILAPAGGTVQGLAPTAQVDAFVPEPPPSVPAISRWGLGLMSAIIAGLLIRSHRRLRAFP